MFTNGYVCAHQLKNQIIPFAHLKQNLMLGKFRVCYIHWKKLVTKLRYRILVIKISWNQIVFLISILRLVIVWIWGLGFRVECKFVGLLYDGLCITYKQQNLQKEAITKKFVNMPYTMTITICGDWLPLSHYLTQLTRKHWLNKIGMNLGVDLWI